jgi:CubicO group peptidase (beta-lactamase class C family)
MLRLRLAAVGVLAVSAAAPLHAQAAAPVRRVDAIFARFERPDSPGCVVGVSRGGRTVLERAYGSAELEHGVSLTPQSILEAGSVSKQFTAAAIVLLARDGGLSLDDAVRRHVPELPPFADSVTLRHLLTHTSGLRDWGALAALAGWPRGTRVHTHAHVLDILSRQRALNFRPGTEYSYSNSGYNLLAVVAERVSGRSLDQLTRERIFRPLGMTSTRWRDDFTEVVPGRATAYARAGGGYAIDMPFENVYGNGGLLTTVGDLLRWSENFRPGSRHFGRVGGSDLVNLMQTPSVLSAGDTIAYALGLVVGDFRGVREVGHSGATAGYRAYLARYPREELAVALLCNAGDANSTTLAREVAAGFLGGRLRAPEPAVAVSPERLARHAGLYRDSASGDLLRIVLRDGTLRIGFGDDGAELTPLAGGRFRVGAGPDELRWEPAETGVPARVRVLDGRGRPVVYSAVTAASPAANALSAYAGAYDSPELGVTYTVRMAAGRLALQLAPGEPVPLEPADEDAFRSRGAGGPVLLRFTRDGAGRVNGFDLTTGRVHRLRFERR